jgi:preprotein translocase subunit SecE
VARETRRQRRDARKASGAAKPASRRNAAQARAASMQPASTQTGRRETRQRGRFVKEAWAELQKVEWPNRGQVLQGTVVVIIACAIVGTYLYAADQVFKPFVRTVLLGE